MVYKLIARYQARIGRVQPPIPGLTWGVSLELLEQATYDGLTARGRYRFFWREIEPTIKRLARRLQDPDEAVASFYFWLRKTLAPEDFTEFKPNSTHLKRYIKKHGTPTDPADVFRYRCTLTPEYLIFKFKKMAATLIQVQEKIPSIRKQLTTDHLTRALWPGTWEKKTPHIIDIRNNTYTDLLDILPKELQAIAKMYVAGWTTKEIAEELKVTPRTVRNKKEKIKEILFPFL